jgi:hypothetical protein
MTNKQIRALRMVEEAIETAQAMGVSRKVMQHTLDHVYNRPVGDPIQEIGGVLLTTSVLCTAIGWGMTSVFAKELDRCLSLPPEKFAARNQEKINLGITT